jgi:hypothetical protein
MTEIDRIAKQGTQIVDRVLGSLQVP